MRYRQYENPEVRPGDTWRQQSTSIRRVGRRVVKVLGVEDGVARVVNVATGRHSQIRVEAFRSTGRNRGWTLLHRGVIL